MDIINTDDFKNKLAKIDNYVAFFVYHMLKEDDLISSNVYHISYFQKLYHNYYSARITCKDLKNEFRKIYAKDVGFTCIKENNYQVNLNTIINGLIEYVNIQFEKNKLIEDI